MNQLTDDDYCSHCRKSTLLVTDYSQGTVLCTLCGLIVEDYVIDFTTEYRLFEDGSGNDRVRVGAVRNDDRNDGGLSLGVTGSKSKVGMLSDRLNSNTDDKMLYRGQHLISTWGNLLDLQKKVIDKAKEELLKVRVNHANFKGRSVEAIAAAIIYVAVRKHSIPLKPATLESTCGVSITEIKRAYKFLKKNVGYIPPLKASRYCQNFSAKLGLPLSLSHASEKIAEVLQDRLEGRTPQTIASLSMYIAIQLTPHVQCSLKNICLQSGMSENTIKNAYKLIFEDCHKIIPDWEGRLPISHLKK